MWPAGLEPAARRVSDGRSNPLSYSHLMVELGVEVIMASAQPKPDFDREWARLESNQRPLACETSALRY